MSKTEERYEGNFLDALDLPEGVLVPVTIDSMAEPGAEKDAADKPIKQAILRFKGKQKRLILNKTNYRNLKAMFGLPVSKWIGQSIQLQRRYLDASRGFGVNNTLCIRIVPPIGTPILKSAANFMGSVTPYDDNGKPTTPKKATKPQPTPRPAEKPTEDYEAFVAALENVSDAPTLQRLLGKAGTQGFSEPQERALRELLEYKISQAPKEAVA